jgi:hypothetical protein
MISKITEIFYLADEFCKEFNKARQGHILNEEAAKKSRNRQFTLSDSEVITIMILFHLGNFRTFKHFYINYIQCTGISFIDSTPLRVCHIRRESPHKVFKGMATKGQCSIGWFFGFKLHIVINDKGEILDFLFTQANVEYPQHWPWLLQTRMPL